MPKSLTAKNGKSEESDDKATRERKEREEQLKDAEAKKTLAETEKATAEALEAAAKALKAAREAAYPEAEAKALEGTTVFDDSAGAFAQVVAREVLDRCVRQLATKANLAMEASKALLDSAETKVLIVDTLDFAAADLVRLQVEQQIAVFEAELERRLKERQPPETFGLPIAGALEAGLAAKSAVGMLADLVAYFRTDYKVMGKDVPVDDDALRISVAGALKWRAYLLNLHVVETSLIVERFVRLMNLRDQVDSKQGEQPADGWVELKRAVDDYAKWAVTSTDGQKPPLVQAIARDWIRREQITHLFYLKTVSVGADVITQRSLWPWKNNKVRYMAAGSVSFALAEASGCIRAAATASASSTVRVDIGAGGPSSLTFTALSGESGAPLEPGAITRAIRFIWNFLVWESSSRRRERDRKNLVVPGGRS